METGVRRLVGESPGGRGMGRKAESVSSVEAPGMSGGNEFSDIL